MAREGQVRLSLTTKIFLAFAFLLLTFAAVASFSIRQFHEIGERLRDINEGHLVLARIAGQLETLQQNRFRDLRRARAEADPASRAVVLRIASAYFPDVVQARVDEVREVCRRQLARLDQKATDGDAEAKRELYRSILARVDRIGEGHEAVDELSEQLLLHARTATTAAAPSFDADLDRLEGSLRGEVYQLSRTIQEETDRAVQRTEVDERNAIWRVIAMTILAILVGLLVTLLSARALAPMRALVDFARAISRGDYEHEVGPGGEDELSQLADELQQMARSRKEREAELDRQQAELEAAYHWVADLKRYHESVVLSLKTAVIVTDRDLLITSANRAAESLGLASDHARGQRLETLPLGAELVRRVGSPSKLLEATDPVHLAALALQEQLFDLSITPFRNELGAVMGLVLAVEDVTEAARTKEALIRSERLAAIGRMSAHVTHEVRNPLASIGLNAELLEALIAESGVSGKTAEEAQALSRAIGREVDRLTAITEEYLRFARLPRPELSAEDLRPLLASVAAFVRRDCEAAGVRLELQLPEQAPLVEVDADQMRQAVLNLVRNAKESMPSGGTIELGLEAQDGEVAIRVRDGGIGIEPANLDRIFDPFFSTKLTGTGLGLALCHQIVTEHGARLLVRSEPHRGSEFRIVMAAREGSEPAGLSDRSRPPARATGS
ncbi:MAG: PAS domain-containing protein [Deltaproteobacteria bacterium]|nr:PAS domain-containing protein [Deltaproteobacteria bacterium]